MRPLPAIGTVGEVGLDGHDHRWITRVEDRDAVSLVVVAPTRPRGDAILPELGTAVRFGWAAEVGFHEATGRLVATGQDVIATWVVAVRAVHRQQRRSAFRLPVGLGVEVTVAGRRVTGTTRDLSEGGLRCVLPLGSGGEPGDRVEVELAVPGAATIEAPARVVRRRVEPPSATGPGEVELALGFADTDPVRAEAVRRFVFDEQLRRRGS